MFAIMKTKTLAIVGCGKLAKIVAEALNRNLLTDYKLVATYSRTFESAQGMAKDFQGCKPCKSIDELLELKPNYIVETASPESLKTLAIPALKKGCSIVTLSIGALADTSFYREVETTAAENGARVHLASGAIGGFDVMRTIALMENCTVKFKTEKGPNSLKNTSVYEEALQTERREVFKGDATGAIELFPTRVNVAVAAALASVGPENTKVSINSIPGFVGDDHRIEVESEQISAVIDIYSKTAQIAGWSVVNTLRNISSPIVF